MNSFKIMISKKNDLVNLDFVNFEIKTNSTIISKIRKKIIGYNGDRETKKKFS